MVWFGVPDIVEVYTSGGRDLPKVERAIPKQYLAIPKRILISQKRDDTKWFKTFTSTYLLFCVVTNIQITIYNL